MENSEETVIMKRAACLMLLLMLPATISQAQQPEVARNTCSECHATQKGQLLSPNLSAPTFVEIANTPGVTAAALTLMLTTPHAGMPMFKLSSEQRQQIIDYVLDLKTRN
jgi:mono/diheme cytochrome c family protein